MERLKQRAILRMIVAAIVLVLVGSACTPGAPISPELPVPESTAVEASEPQTTEPEIAEQATATAEIPPKIAPPPITPGQETFDLRVLITGLNQPWEIAYGPDGHLWLTERLGKRVLRVNPVDGQMQPLITIDEVFAESSQQGLLGMALHPELLQGTGNDYIFVAFTTNPNGSNPLDRLMTIRRYTYDSATDQLVDPFDLFNNLPGSTDHNGARLTFGTDGKLYYPIGDRGANNLGNYCRPNDAQTLPTAEDVAAGNWRYYVGKILRLNLDGSIPADNPEWNGVRSHVYSVGHRNPQGLVAGRNGIYAAEHGPKTDDEVNFVQPGKNYGWPHVAGYQDDQAYVYARWSDAAVDCNTLQFNDYTIPETVPQQAESAWSDQNFRPPLHTFGTVPSDYNFQIGACDPNFYICWPTIAPTGIDFYAGGGGDISGWGIPGWTDSLLVAALKTGTIYRLPLSNDGAAVHGQPLPYFNTTNRYRDLAIAPDGRTFYIITDNGGTTQDASGLPTNALDHPGAILVFTHKSD